MSRIGTGMASESHGAGALSADSLEGRRFRC